MGLKTPTANLQLVPSAMAGIAVLTRAVSVVGVADTVTVTLAGEHAYDVLVTQGGRTTSHRVTVPPGVLARWGKADADEEAVVRESFAFLLEREPASSIMSRFSLDVIGRYFPEYERELPGRLP
jgi:hypothetical protein